jgi:hypothetical protein
VHGPSFSILYNEISLPVSLAARVGTWSDNEDVVSSDVFAIRNFSTAWFTTLAAAVPWRGWRIGGQVDLDHVEVSGRSRDPDGYHQDDYTWNRPTTKFRFNLIRPEENRLSAGLNFAGLHRNGTEQGRISWSDRFPPNPSRTNYLVTVPTFEEEERDYGRGGSAIACVLPRLADRLVLELHTPGSQDQWHFPAPRGRTTS